MTQALKLSLTASSIEPVQTTSARMPGRCSTSRLAPGAGRRAHPSSLALTPGPGQYDSQGKGSPSSPAYTFGGSTRRQGLRNARACAVHACACRCSARRAGTWGLALHVASAEAAATIRFFAVHVCSPALHMCKLLRRARYACWLKTLRPPCRASPTKEQPQYSSSGPVETVAAARTAPGGAFPHASRCHLHSGFGIDGSAFRFHGAPHWSARQSSLSHSGPASQHIGYGQEHLQRCALLKNVMPRGVHWWTAC